MKKSKQKLREKRSKGYFARFVSFTIKSVLLMVIVIAGYQFIKKYKTEPTILIEERIVEKNVGVSLEKKIAELKEDFMADLFFHEAPSGYQIGDLVITFDPLESQRITCSKSGGVRLYCYSFGPLQWKIGTLIEEYEREYGIVLSEQEAFQIAQDYDQAIELAEKTIFSDTKGGIWKWRNSANKIDAAKRIEFIRSLEN